MPTSPSQSLALSRHAVVAQAFEIMADHLGPFIDERMGEYFADEPSWAEAAANRLGRPAEHGATDPLFQLLVLRRFWGPVFADYYNSDLRKIIQDLIDVRNQWAHFRLPDDTELLDRAILSAERLLATIAPEATGSLRQLRAQLKAKSAVPAGAATGPADAEGGGAAGPESGLGADSDGGSAIEAEMSVNVGELESQLAETESVFKDLQDRYGDLEEQLSTSRRIAAQKQLRLATLERQLVDIEVRSQAAEEFLAAERYTRNRIEWLFVGLLATLLLFMVLAGSY